LTQAQFTDQSDSFGSDWQLQFTVQPVIETQLLGGLSRGLMFLPRDEPEFIWREINS